MGIEIAAIAATVIGAGISAYSQYAQGRTQSAIASYNADTQRRNAEMQLRAMTAQAEIERSAADKILLLRTAEANAREQNAQNIEAQALAQDSVNRLNLMKRREEFARMQGSQRAAIAASGVVESSGTPLDLLAETAAKIQQDASEQHYIAELRRRTLFTEAANERLGGQFALAGATLERDSQLAGAALRESAGQGQYLAGLRESEISRLTGQSAKRAGMYGAAGTLFGAATNLFRTS